MKPARILIVDDSFTNRKLLRVQLEAEGCEISEAENGRIALDVLEHEKFDACISDLLMPVMDGYRLCHELRQHKKLKHLAVIHYTSTFTSGSDQQLSQTVGADGFLTKPVSVRVLVAALENAMHHAQERTTSALNASDQIFVMKEYSVTLVKKMEEKNRELEQAMLELRRAHSDLGELKESLELRVRERSAALECSNRELTSALAEVTELSGLLSMCAWCKKIRDTDEYWHELEEYISRHSKAQFNHGICPSCLQAGRAKLNSPPSFVQNG